MKYKTYDPSVCAPLWFYLCDRKRSDETPQTEHSVQTSGKKHLSDLLLFSLINRRRNWSSSCPFMNLVCDWLSWLQVKDSQLLRELGPGPGRGQVSVVQQLLDQVPASRPISCFAGSPDVNSDWSVCPLTTRGRIPPAAGATGDMRWRLPWWTVTMTSFLFWCSEAPTSTSSPDSKKTINY